MPRIQFIYIFTMSIYGYLSDYWDYFRVLREEWSDSIPESLVMAYQKVNTGIPESLEPK